MLERILSSAVARARAESTRVRELLAQLEGRRVAIQVLGTPLHLLLESTGTDLNLSRATGDADATVRGSPLALLALSGPDAQSVINRGEVQIEGSTHVAQQFRDLARLLRPELEPLLSSVLGRSLAHLFMRGVHGVADWTRAAAWTQVQNLAEYLAHERSALVSRAEAEGFLRGVDEARDQMERIAARLSHLETHPTFSGGREPV
jgi:ubiquinone biosynthesis protein UbiJ